MKSVDQLLVELDQVAAMLNDGSYRRGAWQRLTRAVRSMPSEERRTLSNRISEVGSQLHRRHGFPELPFTLALLVEVTLVTSGVGLMVIGGESWIFALMGLGALVVSLQPTLKVLLGLMLGIRYTYAYLWYVEPRFKMQYGTYLSIERWRRVMFHIAGSLGTPGAFLTGLVLIHSSQYELQQLCWYAFWLLALLQIGSFLAPFFGLRQVAGLPLHLLTSPATAAEELTMSGAPDDG